jgi:23S rRNA pseudouridine2604 synthase
MTKPCVAEAINETSFRIILTQGLNRQIRRMCEHLGYEVKRLKRVRIMNIQLDTKIGEWRDLTARELSELNRLLDGSEKTIS